MKRRSERMRRFYNPGKKGNYKKVEMFYFIEVLLI